jgi:uncharacterized protein with PIN domain
MSDHKKKQKMISKRCPECGGQLETAMKTHEDDGVIYEDQYIECMECDYSYKIKVSPKRYKDNPNPKW